jgi:PAS domain S-box-containing protein
VPGPPTPTPAPAPAPPPASVPVAVPPAAAGNVPRRAFWALAIGGPLLTVVTFLALSASTDEQAQKAFDRYADQRALVLDRAIDADVTLLRATEAFFAGSETVTMDELATFFRTIGGPRPGPDALMWVPALRYPEGKATLEDIRKRLPGFHVEEAAPGGRRVPASERPEQHPVALVDPATAEAPWLGLDLATVPEIRTEIAVSASVGKPLTTSLVSAGDGSEPAEMALVVHPVYRGPRAPMSASERAKTLLGHVVVMWKLEGLLRRTRPEGQAPGVDLVLYDVPREGPAQVLAVLPSATRTGQDADAAKDALKAGRRVTGPERLRRTVAVPVPGRTWRVEFRATPAFQSGSGSSLTWVVLLAGLLVSGLLTYLYGSSLRRERAVERLVAERTAALSIANRDLRQEFEQHARAEQAVLRQQREHRTILDSVPAMIWFKDADDRILRANRAAAALADATPEAAEGMPVRDLFPGSAERLHRADLEVMRTGIPSLGNVESVTVPDGRQRWLRLDRLPSRDEQGRVSGVIVFAQDVTERLEAEAKARENEEIFRAVSLNIPDGLVIADPTRDGRLLHANEAACRLHGLNLGEILQRRFVDLLDEASASQVPDRFERLAAGEVLRYDEVHRRKDGTSFHVEATARRIRWQGRDVILAIDRDVTQRRRAEEERRTLERRVQHAQRLESLGVLAGGIAHDFNNLLMGILGNADIALQELPAGSPARERIEDVRTGGVRARELTLQMLAYSGRGTFVVEPVDLAALVRDIAHLLRVAVGASVKLEFASAESVPLVMADAAQVRQIVMNLITNASEAIGDRPGTVTLSTGSMHADRAFLHDCLPDPDIPEGDYAWVEVSDTGSGMDDATKARIFDPFFTTKFTGRGLGLAAVLGIVRGHRGAIRVRSAPGRGSTFRVLFPVSRDAASLPAAVEPAPAGDWRASGTVLVVDDDDTVRTVVRRMLKACGLESREASDGRAGVDALRAAPDDFVAVLLDMTMPQMGGEEAFREIRRIRPGVPVILMSGYTEQDAAARFRGLGLSGFVQKPFTREALVARLRTVVPSPPPPRPARSKVPPVA